jgi:uncharacterized membrane protein YphA (DoxX/SURF4 family)
MNPLIQLLSKTGLLRKDLDYHLIRASMVIIYFFFGYQKWFNYEAQGLIPFFTHGPLIFWMYPVFGVKGASYFLGVSEWLFGALLFAGFWNKKLGVLGALGSIATFCNNHHYYPFHAKRLGSICGRISRDGRKRSFPHERCGSSRRLLLPLERGHRSSAGFH